MGKKKEGSLAGKVLASSYLCDTFGLSETRFVRRYIYNELRGMGISIIFTMVEIFSFFWLLMVEGTCKL